MDKEKFVQNIHLYCTLKGVKPTLACAESGVSTSFLTNIKKGQTPSVAKVQQLASYLGVTTSELLGEPAPGQTQKSPDSMSAAEAALDAELIARLCQLSPGDLQKVDAFVQGLLAAR